MKNSLLIGLLCLGIGFAAAWLVKPEAVAEESADTQPAKKNTPPPSRANPSVAAADKPAKSDNRPESPAPNPAAGFVPGGQDPARAERMQGRWQEMMERRQQAKEEAEIKKLVARLGLSDAQADQLRAYFKKNREKLQAMMQDGNQDWSRVKEFTKAMRGDGLDEALADILTDEQKGAYEEMQQRDRANKVEARAYKDLASIQSVVDLTPEQKDQVYDILHEQADKKVDANKDANTMVSVFTEGLGINIDPADLGISSFMQVQIDRAASGDQPDPQNTDWQKVMAENRKKEVDQKVELLAPVLDDKQEESYRTHLESQGAGLLGGLLQGGGLEVDQLNIPVPDSE